MKIVCDNCGAKYAIADEKVAGRVFKLRCKKCGEPVVVRGDQIADETGFEEEATRVYDGGGDRTLYAVVDGEQRGPFNRQQLAAMFVDGTVDWDTYLWREGLDGWKAARELPEAHEAFAEAPQQGGAASGASLFSSDQEDAVPASEARAAATGEAAGAPADAAGVTATAEGDSGHRPAPKPGPEDEADEAPDETAEVAAATAESASQPAEPSADAQSHDSGTFRTENPSESGPAPAPTPRQPLTGERNESSVLFSLENLTAKASASEAAPSGGRTSSTSGTTRAAASSTAGPAGARAPSREDEGSGLIDIRALAQATQTAPRSAPGREDAAEDDLLGVGASPLGGPVLGAPVLTPPEPEPEPKTRWWWLAVAALVVVVGGGVFAMQRSGGPSAPSTLAPGANPPSQVAAPTGGSPAPQAEAAGP
ncbi:MAG: zinc-ribbon domain-containing protein, partial [Myxococcales bacterium]|nr:zinc-ribbon domain-containing protein [Myxococcales bacterium]